MITKNSAGQDFDLSEAETFDFSQFFAEHLEGERLQVSREEVDWLQTYTPPREAVDVVLNLSCGVQAVPHLMLTQVAIFRALGISFAATAGRQYCCGRIYQRYGRPGLGDRMAAKAIDRFASWHAPTNVQCCGSCLIEFDYHVARRTEETGTAPFDVIHITRFLRDRLSALGAAAPWTTTIPRRVLLHAEGAEVHPTKEEARTAVIETLALIPGVEYVGLVRNPTLGQPCAATYPGGPSVLHDVTPEQYREVQAELEEQARAVGADSIVTHHHQCHREWCKFGSDRLPVIHYQTLLAEALGLSVPDRFQTLWRLGDPELVLERSRPHWESWGIPESDARDMVRRHFVPRYAAAIQRCPCEGQCADAVNGSGAACETSWTAAHARGVEIPMIQAHRD
jgi:hypothetical protein